MTHLVTPSPFLPPTQELPRIVEGVMSDDPAWHLECTTHLRKLLSIKSNPPIQEVEQPEGLSAGDTR